MVAIAIFTGFLSGGSSAGLIALISRSISQSSSGSLTSIGWAFIGLALVSLITSIVSQVTLIRLAQRAIFQLRLTLSRQILASDLAHLEKLGLPGYWQPLQMTSNLCRRQSGWCRFVH